MLALFHAAAVAPTPEAARDCLGAPNTRLGGAILVAAAWTSRHGVVAALFARLDEGGPTYHEKPTESVGR